NFLPEGCRAIFNLFAIEGYPHKEIAVMLSISEGTSKSQLNFARKKLQELLVNQNI
ncbi:MAG: RNA polymerase sigma factor, partial [Chryseobacterium sp.]